MNPKITEQHRSRPAYIYVRQSTNAQVLHHQESTERQYALRAMALELGWSESAIRTLDRDLGMTGTEMTRREDFKTLVADVSMGQVGAVFALEVSRLARSNLDWHRLLELCALTATLVIDEDGCYDPSDFNDGLLLGLKGTMAQAELHFLHARLQGGKLNKAKKGELRFPLPVGYCYDEQGRIVPDADAEVRGAVAMVFRLFRETGSAYAVVHRFTERGLRFPKRAYGGAWDGKIIWGRLSHSRVLGAEGYRWCVDLDLEKFFDRVSHDKLMARIETRVSDRRLLKLIRTFLKAGVMEGGLVSPVDEGTPQGGPLSPLLSNIVLDEFDRELERRASSSRVYPPRSPHRFCSSFTLPPPKRRPRPHRCARGSRYASLSTIAQENGRDVERHILPLLRRYGIRFVQLARHGHLEADGITVLSDTRQPTTVYLDGDLPAVGRAPKERHSPYVLRGS